MKLPGRVVERSRVVMPSEPRHTRTLSLVVASGLAALTAAVVAQTGPVAAMFSDDQRRAASRTLSFERVELPATATASVPLQVYLSAGDVERSFDTAAFRPDAAIVPTNTDLQIKASWPATQRVLIERVQKQADVWRELEDQIATRRTQPASTASGETGLLRIGVDSFVVHLSSPAAGGQGQGAFPKSACLVATDFAAGGAVDRRELFFQDRVRQGIASCLDALDAKGATSLVLPLMGASSAKIQRNDARFEGQRALKECRLMNSTAGIALGIHDFAARRRNLCEIGVVQRDQDIAEMFEVPAGSPAARSADRAYRIYAEQILHAFRRGLDGRKTLAGDVNGSCSAILDSR
jgi:hypothetical protein